MPNVSREDAFGEITRYLRRFDIDIEKMEMEPIASSHTGEESKYSAKSTTIEPPYRITCYHRNTKEEMIALDFQDESQGTQLLFGLLGIILAKLRTGGVLVIDEIDRSLHSRLLSALVSLFCKRKYNTNGTQLILTAHNTDLLEASFLRASQVAIVTKPPLQGTFLRRICDFKDVKNCQNLRKLYLHGGLSGVPFPII